MKEIYLQEILNSLKDSVTVEILENLLDVLKQKTSKPYDYFMQHLKKVEPLKKKLSQENLDYKLERHHILPKHDGGSDDPTNLVLVTVQEHIAAHWLRWKQYQQTGDKMAYIFRSQDNLDKLQIRIALVKEARKRDKEENVNFFNSEFQSRMGKKGGSIGGSRNTPEQFAARSRVGEKHGRQVGISNQGEFLRNFVQNTIIWSYNPSKDRFAKKLAKAKNLPIDNKIEYFVTGPKPAFKDIIRSLTTYKKIENYSESKFYGVAYGHKKSAKGCQIVKTLTRNEVEEGIVQFQWENPEIELVFEPNFSCLLFAKQKEDKDRNVESKAS